MYTWLFHDLVRTLGSGTVLLADEEEAVCRISTTMLKPLKLGLGAVLALSEGPTAGAEARQLQDDGGSQDLPYTAQAPSACARRRAAKPRRPQPRPVQLHEERQDLHGPLPVLRSGRAAEVLALMGRSGPRLLPSGIRWLGWALACALLASPARADETTLAEPIIEDNITDIDSVEVGSLEVDWSGALLRPRAAGRMGVWSTTLEAEWRALERLGLGAEFAAAGASNGAAPRAASLYGGRLAASYVLMRDDAANRYLQAEVAGRQSAGAEPAFPDATESALPYVLGVRWASQHGPLTLRAAVFGEAGGAPQHAPVRASMAALWLFEPASSRAYLGLEIIGDAASRSPAMLIPQGLVLMKWFGKAVRFGLGGISLSY